MNMTVNGTEQSSCFNPAAEKIGGTFAYCLIFVVSLAGNTFIGIVVYKTKTLRKPINFLIVNMAMFDLLSSVFLFPRLVKILYVDSWPIKGPLGQALCKLPIFFADVGVTVSIQSLVLIAVERFGAVVFPFRPPLISSKLCPFFILATWIVAMALHFPDLLISKLVEYPAGLKCEQKWEGVFVDSLSYKNYLLSSYVLFLYFPLVVMTILYCVILKKLKSQKIPGQPSVNSRAEQQRLKRERNVLKMAVAIVLGFSVCWVPFSVIVLLDIFAWDHAARFSCGVMIYLYISLYLARAQCALNPCICFIFSGNYRQAFWNLFSCS